MAGSIGLSEFQDRACHYQIRDPPSQIIDQADKASYQAKQTENTLVLAEDWPASV